MKKLKFILVAILSLGLMFTVTACGTPSAKPEVTHSFSVNKSNVELEIGEEFQIVASYGENDITYTVDKSDIATVDNTGKVVAKKVGVAYVTISAGSEQRTCKVTVIEAEYTVEIINGDVYTVVGTAKKLQALLTRNGNIYNGSVTWSTTGGNIEADGLIAWFTADVKGEYTITVTSDAGVTTSCVITVIEDLADIG